MSGWWIRAAWVSSLHRLGVAHLFVAMLSAHEINYQWHNAGGFPVEDAWAAPIRSHSASSENAQVRITPSVSPDTSI